MLGATAGFLAASGAGYGLYMVAGATVASLPVALAAGVGLGIAGGVFGAGLGGGAKGESSYLVPYGPGAQNLTAAEDGEVLGPPLMWKPS